MLLEIKLSNERKDLNGVEWRNLHVAVINYEGEEYVAKDWDYTIRKVAKALLYVHPELGDVLAFVTRDSRTVLNPRKLGLIATGKAYSGGGELNEGLRAWQKRNSCA